MVTTPHCSVSTASVLRVARCAGAALGLWGLSFGAWSQTQVDDGQVPQESLGQGVPSVYALQPNAGDGVQLSDDPSLRIMVGTRSVPLSFSLIKPESDWGAWADASLGPVLPPGGLAPGLPPRATTEPTMRLWIPMQDSGQRLRFTHAYVNLTRPSFADGDLQVRPGAGVVMQLSSRKGYLQELSLGSVFRLNMSEGSQVALRMKGGRLGVQYRLQFNL